jgi:hypothetical protein
MSISDGTLSPDWCSGIDLTATSAAARSPEKAKEIIVGLTCCACADIPMTRNPEKRSKLKQYLKKLEDFRAISTPAE